MSDKTHEIINKLYVFVDTGNKKLIEKYTLEEMIQVKCHYKPYNSKLPDLTPIIDNRINELKEINLAKRKKREKWLDRLFGFISGMAVTLASVYLKGCLKLEK
ncbi:MAG: hypothetical protein Q7J72_10205 [Candidatus Omnitrophota bacterium]|nr:hypothetical protein [Candidatus Omnitrophota bacterium]